MADISASSRTAPGAAGWPRPRAGVHRRGGGLAAARGVGRNPTRLRRTAAQLPPSGGASPAGSSRAPRRAIRRLSIVAAREHGGRRRPPGDADEALMCFKTDPGGRRVPARRRAAGRRAEVHVECWPRSSSPTRSRRRSPQACARAGGADADGRASARRSAASWTRQLLLPRAHGATTTTSKRGASRRPFFHEGVLSEALGDYASVEGDVVARPVADQGGGAPPILASPRRALPLATLHGESPTRPSRDRRAARMQRSGSRG